MKVQLLVGGRAGQRHGAVDVALEPHPNRASQQRIMGEETMQLATQTSVESLPPGTVAESDVVQRDPRYSQYKVIRRNGAVVRFEPSKITVAMAKAFIAVNGGTGAASARVRELVGNLTEQAVAALIRRQPSGGTFHIEDIQDQVELAL